MEVLLITKVRTNTGSVIDSVVQDKPQVVRHNRDIIVPISQKDMLFLLHALQLKF